LLPLILTCCVVQQEEQCSINQSNGSIKKENEMLKLLFNLIERPDHEQRCLLLASCIQFAKLMSPTYVNSELLPKCWEQINEKSQEKRLMIAESCAILAPFISIDMRSSLMFSIAKHIIEQEKCEIVRICAAKSFSILINYIKEKHKLNQVYSA
jgi:hypothetical protein